MIDISVGLFRHGNYYPSSASLALNPRHSQGVGKREERRGGRCKKTLGGVYHYPSQSRRLLILSSIYHLTLLISSPISILYRLYIYFGDFVKNNCQTLRRFDEVFKKKKRTIFFLVCVRGGNIVMNSGSPRNFRPVRLNEEACSEFPR